MNRQKLLLAILLGVLALALVYAFWKTPRQRQVVNTPGSNMSRHRAPQALKKESSGGRTRVHIDLLNREKQAFPGAKKDIFGPLYVEKPPPPPPPAPPVVRVPPPASQVAPPAPETVQNSWPVSIFSAFCRKMGRKPFSSPPEMIFLS